MTIYMMWYQGLDAAPELVRRLHRIWQETHGTKTIRLISGQEADDVLASNGIDPSQLTMQVRSNLIRLIKLGETGGAWADATLLPSTEMNKWFQTVLSPSGFFAFRNENRDRVICSWLLASKKGNFLTEAWRDFYIDFFRRKRILNKHAPFWTKLSQEIRKELKPASFADPSYSGKQTFYPYHVLHYHFDYLIQKTPPARQFGRTPPNCPENPVAD